MDPENWPTSSQYLNPLDFLVWVLCNKSCIVKFRDVDYLKCIFVKLLGSDKSRNSKRSDRTTVKSSDYGN